MHRDMRGREIRVGDIVAYPGRKGSSLWLTVGEVVDFGSRFVWGDERESVLKVRPIDFFGEKDGQVRTVGNLDRVVVVEPAVR